jgi:serine/threonine protein kinase
MDVMPHPTTVGKYRLLHEIGKGSMGRVYLGHDALIERDVAVKIALPERLACPGPENTTRGSSSTKPRRPGG